MRRNRWLILAIAALVGLLALAAACGDDDDGGDAGKTPGPEEIAEFEQVVTQMIETDPADEAAVDFFVGHVADEAFSYFGYENGEDCAADPEDCIGEPSEVVSVSGTEISGGEASTSATTAEGDILNVKFVREDEVWKLSGFAFSADIPAGVTTVEVSGVEYGFDWDPADVGDGNVAFAFTNDGAEMHELAILGVSEDFDIEAVKEFAQSGDFESDPPGTTGFVGFAMATPGLASNAVLEEPLAPGGYVFLCVLPTADGTPHVVVDMYSEFTVE